MATCRTCVAIELSNLAITQYVDWDMAGMIEFDDLILGGNEEGLFQLYEGDTDAGVDIDAYVKTIKTDFGEAGQKRLRRLYLGYEADGDVSVVITVDDGYNEEYVVDLRNYDNIQHGQVQPVNSTLKGRYFDFKFSNEDGCDFSLDSVDALVLGLVGFNSTL